MYINRYINIMVGIPASGKSSLIEYLKDDDDVVISSDSIRKELGYSEDQTKNHIVFNILYERIEKAMKSGTNHIFHDSCSIKPSTRIKSITLAKKYEYIVVVYFLNNDLEICLRRNESRDRVVPKHVLEKMYYNLIKPEFEEGIDYIVEIKNK